MPVVALQPTFRIFPWFIYPPSGQARIYIEASLPVDIFVANPQLAPQITSAQFAAASGALGFTGRVVVDQIVTIPALWRPTGWNLVIANPSAQIVAAVYYFVTEHVNPP